MTRGGRSGRRYADVDAGWRLETIHINHQYHFPEEVATVMREMKATGQRMGPSGMYVRGRRDEEARARKAMKIQAALAVAVGFSAGWIARSWLDWSQFQNMFGPTL